MKLIVGLGNPGKEHEKTRHNAGFMMADKLRKEWNFPKFKFDKKFNAEAIEGKLFSFVKRGLRGIFKKGDKVLLAKPQSYMNNSGLAVKKIMKFYKLKLSDIIVIHDDLDIDLGKYKVSENSHAAGHNGVQNIIDALGTQKFKRVRIGIEGPAKRKTRKIPGDEFVLKNFTKAENKIIQKVLEEIIAFILKMLTPA